jgi:hypothetical protein
LLLLSLSCFDPRLVPLLVVSDLFFQHYSYFTDTFRSTSLVLTLLQVYTVISLEGEIERCVYQHKVLQFYFLSQEHIHFYPPILFVLK